MHDFQHFICRWSWKRDVPMDFICTHFCIWMERFQPVFPLYPSIKQELRVDLETTTYGHGTLVIAQITGMTSLDDRVPVLSSNIKQRSDHRCQLKSSDNQHPVFLFVTCCRSIADHQCAATQHLRRFYAHHETQAGSTRTTQVAHTPNFRAETNSARHWRQLQQLSVASSGWNPSRCRGSVGSFLRWRRDATRRKVWSTSRRQTFGTTVSWAAFEVTKITQWHRNAGQNLCRSYDQKNSDQWSLLVVAAQLGYAAVRDCSGFHTHHRLRRVPRLLLSIRKHHGVSTWRFSPGGKGCSQLTQPATLDQLCGASCTGSLYLWWECFWKFQKYQTFFRLTHEKLGLINCKNTFAWPNTKAHFPLFAGRRRPIFTCRQPTDLSVKCGVLLGQEHKTVETENSLACPATRGNVIHRVQQTSIHVSDPRCLIGCLGKNCHRKRFRDIVSAIAMHFDFSRFLHGDVGCVDVPGRALDWLLCVRILFRVVRTNSRWGTCRQSTSKWTIAQMNMLQWQNPNHECE